MKGGSDENRVRTKGAITMSQRRVESNWAEWWMSMQLSRLLTTLVWWGLDGNGPELIPTRYRAIGNLRLAESHYTWTFSSQFWSVRQYLQDDSERNPWAVYEVPWYPLPYGASTMAHWNVKFWAFLGPGNVTLCLESYILALLWISCLLKTVTYCIFNVLHRYS